MNLSINQTTAFAINTLAKYKHGIVHSVYRRTINLSFDNQLLALQADNSPVSPISFITSLDSKELEALDISIGDQVIISKNKLTIIGNHENYSFRYGQAKIFDTSFSSSLSYAEISFLRTTISEILSQVNTGGLDLVFNEAINEDSPLTIQMAEKKISSIRHFLCEEKFDEAAQESIRLIGLGSGLTPSGDDFLCGVLAGLQLLKLNNHVFSFYLKSAIKEHLQDTIDISAAFLSCALKNQFSLAVNSLSNVPLSENMKENFLAIGHSSGIDTLCGVYFALDTLGHVKSHGI